MDSENLGLLVKQGVLQPADLGSLEGMRRRTRAVLSMVKENNVDALGGSSFTIQGPQALENEKIIKDDSLKTIIEQGKSLDLSQDFDSASTATKDTYGGINLNSELLDLQIKRDGNGIPLPLSEQPIEQMKIEGFLPYIIQITPVTNLPLLLGLNAVGNSDNELSLRMKSILN